MRGLNTCFQPKPNLFGLKIRKGAYLLLGQNMRGKNAPLPNKRKRSVTFSHTEDQLNDRKSNAFVRGLCKK